MNELDDENRIIELLRSTPVNKVYILSNDPDSKMIYESIVFDAENWKDNSGKDAPPPDFINAVDSIMLEVMRVNDTSSDSNRRETEMQQELKDSGILEMFPNIKAVTCIPDVHSQSYTSYIKSFTKSYEKHNKKVNDYRNNHPDISKVAFLVCDESESYFERHESTPMGIKARYHLWFTDKKFMQLIKDSNPDVVIWFTPYKVPERDGFVFPTVVVINPSLVNESIFQEYDPDLMVDATRMERKR